MLITWGTTWKKEREVYVLRKGGGKGRSLWSPEKRKGTATVRKIIDVQAAGRHTTNEAS